MHNYVEIAIIGALTILVLFLFKAAFGAGTLEQLQNQANTDTTYRNELVNYLHAHNMTVMDTRLKVNEHMNISTLENYELEAVVKGHINDCQSGTFDRMAEIFNLSKSELAEKYGNC